MKSSYLLIMLFALPVLFSCRNDQKEEKNQAANKSEAKIEALRYRIDTKTSITTYVGSKPTGKHNGKVAISQGFFEVQENQVIGGKVILDMNSISVDDIGDGEEALGKSVLINHLKSSDFLDVENYPTGEFKITSVVPYHAKTNRTEKKQFESAYKPMSETEHIVANPTHQMVGDLVLRGVSKTVSFPVRIEKLKTKIKLEGKFNIDRTQWNIKYSEEASATAKFKDKFIYDTVNLGFTIEASHPSKTIITPSLAPKMVDAFEKKFDIHEGKRRNHINGFCFSGYFKIKDPDIKEICKSNIFSTSPLKVKGRLSHKGGVKKDESQPGEYGMAFEITLEDGSTQNFSMNTLDFFPVKSPEGFYQLMQAKVSGKTEDFEKLKQDHPEFKNFKSHYKNKTKVLKTFANHQFNSVNAFYLENEKKEKIAVRWSFVPQNENISLDKSKKVDFFEETQKALNKNKKLVWEMVVTIANENDKINDASSLWVGEHQQIVAAVLTIDKIERVGDCDTKNFDPLQLQAGFLPSNDPILKFRSPVYAAAFVRRLQETKNIHKHT